MFTRSDDMRWQAWHATFWAKHLILKWTCREGSKGTAHMSVVAYFTVCSNRTVQNKRFLLHHRVPHDWIASYPRNQPCLLVGHLIFRDTPSTFRLLVWRFRRTYWLDGQPAWGAHRFLFLFISSMLVTWVWIISTVNNKMFKLFHKLSQVN